jgi:hypothetical protein
VLRIGQDVPHLGPPAQRDDRRVVLDEQDVRRFTVGLDAGDEALLELERGRVARPPEVGMNELGHGL